MPDPVPERLRRVAAVVLKKHRLRTLRYSSTSRLIKDGYAHKLFELVNSTYSHLYGFTPLTRAQIDYYIKMYISMLTLDFLTLVVDEGSELIGMGVVMPSLSKALQKAQGRLVPVRILSPDQGVEDEESICDFLLIAVRKDYQNKGVNAVIFNDGLPYLARAGAKHAESNPELLDNRKVQSQWSDFEAVQHKRRRAYAKEFEPPR